MTPCNDVIGHQWFGGSCCLHLQGETLVSYHIATRCLTPEDHDLSYINRVANFSKI